MKFGWVAYSYTLECYTTVVVNSHTDWLLCNAPETIADGAIFANHMGRAILFKNKEDATMFKLKYGV